MEYALLIYGREDELSCRSADQKEEAFSAYVAYTKTLREAGVYIGSVTRRG